MKWCKVFIQLSLLCKAYITYVVLERLFSFMNWCNVSIHFSLCVNLESHCCVGMAFFLHEMMQCVHSNCFFLQSSITYAEHRLFTFMNWSHVYIQASLSCKACITYICCPWNAFFPSWTDAKCAIICPFCVKLASHMLHLKCLFSFMNWCSFNYPFCVKLESHMLHLNGIFLHAMCSFNLLFSATLVSHMLHLN